MNDQKIRRPRQADIATLAGVSVSTVSRVLANEPGISESVRRQILKVAAENGYPVKPASEAVAGGLALIASDGVTGTLSVFYEAIVDGLRAGAAEAGMPFEVRLVREDRTTPDAVRDYMRTASAEGLFLVGIDPNDMLRGWLQASMTPTVLVNGTDPRMQFDGVSPANFFGAYEATSRLIKAGHRRVLHLSGSHRHTIRERVRGFEAAINAVPGAEGRFVSLTLQGSPIREAHERTAAALAENAGFTAAFCMNDFIAVGVLEAVTEAGLRVPEDFAIVGFDDLPCALMTNPRLSTMRVDRAALGREAVSLMLARFRNRTAPARHICQAVVPVPGGTVPNPNAENP
ncbi:LacI family transcriptional regulator [Rhizobium leguminosarum]|uniref:LacI family DNA-binding transcriptional regulator n=1 Tax=Rhizobium leguminosarum TaxID=384 RepID=UPI001C96E2AD|nr:LacI family DNA-binding transcriptional regulator [Rhizobium leguminosarum]MBY5592027.1 LacI family transcriptional regulator [Rhizobium leguminosarum]MBY5603554.1 LacI family transcriptional regulator [Rhizobium leguminosarum]MBY5624818.1 LacI family transcriptional regulator [Rhizobium leguminosarum]MBY5645110.1 LacI family transcriptional regulator [Rhizobium leguminosarum]MBY5706112.1 LacI family transcriptional regulator [Rhizobium leguminosarum]